MGKIEHTYTASVTVTGGRGGHAVSDDGVLDVQLRPPKQRGVNDGTNPEQLLAAAWGGCFQSALLAIARAEGVNASGSTVTVDIAVGPDADGNYGLAAKIAVAVPGLDREAVQRLADAAHERCPYSRATRDNIEVAVTALG
jgi:osmotically inducible protein OsmC